MMARAPILEPPHDPPSRSRHLDRLRCPAGGFGVEGDEAMSDWSDAIDPVQRRASNPFRLSLKVDLSKAGKKGGERAKEKARQKRVAADLDVDFSKPYGKGA